MAEQFELVRLASWVSSIEGADDELDRIKGVRIMSVEHDRLKELKWLFSFETLSNFFEKMLLHVWLGAR